MVNINKIIIMMVKTTTTTTTTKKLKKYKGNITYNECELQNDI
jgi:hypothetical protein